MRTFKIPVDIINGLSKDTDSDTIRIEFDTHYMEFIIEGDHVVIRSQGLSVPCLTVQSVVSNVIHVGAAKRLS